MRLEGVNVHLLHERIVRAGAPRPVLEQPAARTSLLTRSRSILLISRQSSFPWGFWKVNGAAAGTGGAPPVGQASTISVICICATGRRIFERRGP